ncbi:response regulator [Burkholderia cenocepacia]|uniref:response regulator n=1 Tax=Burkholderia cepacia complex TaxID=87882 RepID=UPI001BA089CE|nr:response regulator [Burkholderia cenocepacia]MBR8272570.1 response regulator [Burkholderia cenocepacia]
MRRPHVLIVEDEAPKLLHIERFLHSVADDLQIVAARSVNSALDELEKMLPDLLLLDMSLPTFDIGERENGGRPQGFGGIEILRYMALADLKCPTIVITGYEAFLRETGKHMDLSQMRSELMTEFPDFLKGVLHYNSSYDEWKDSLSAVLREIRIDKDGKK